MTISSELLLLHYTTGRLLSHFVFFFSVNLELVQCQLVNRERMLAGEQLNLLHGRSSYLAIRKTTTIRVYSHFESPPFDFFRSGLLPQFGARLLDFVL